MMFPILIVSVLVVIASSNHVFDFEDGSQGWTTAVDGTSACGAMVTASKHWELASTLPGSPGVDLVGTWWTNPNDGNDGAERSHVTSPSITAECTNPIIMTIKFDSYSSNEGGYPTYYDVEHVQLSINDGPFTDVHAHVPSLHNSCDNAFRNITFTTNSGINNGDKLKYRFLFDTCDGCCGCQSVVGWAFDNVAIECNNEPITAIEPILALGACKGFVEMASTTITYDGVQTQIITGDIGVSPGTSITGDFNFIGGGEVKTTTETAQCEADRDAAFATALTLGTTSGALDLNIADISGKVFKAGVYTFAAAIGWSGAGSKVILDGEGHHDAMFLFIAGTTLVTAAGTEVVLQRGAHAANVFWVLGSAATLGAGCIFQGTIIAGTAVTFGTAAELTGRALAKSAITHESKAFVTLPSWVGA